MHDIFIINGMVVGHRDRYGRFIVLEGMIKIVLEGMIKEVEPWDLFN